MVPAQKINNEAELKQLWGNFRPQLTPEQAELARKIWPKIKAKKQAF